MAPLVDAGDLADLQHEVDRLLADDGVSYIPTRTRHLSPRSPTTTGEDDAGVGLAEPQPWRLDPVPLVVSGAEWHQLELGLAQRAELLDRILVDLHTEQRVLADGLLPPLTVFGHEEFLRPLVGESAPGAHRLLMTGADLGSDAEGRWRVLADRTQAPSGVGYAMQNRRVISRVLPELYRESRLLRLTPFFHQLRMALIDAAPAAVEDARVVVLSPGTHSETAFDQAFLAGLLGFPLVEGSDLVVDAGRVWLRSMDRPEPVDVILRRVDSAWADPLELHSGSRLGVTGLVDCVRTGTVAVVNSLGSGVVENPALFPYLPQLCSELLGEELRLPSVPTWWCGDPDGRREVFDQLGDLIIRPMNPSEGRGIHGGRLDRHQRQELRDRITAEPHRFVAQEILPLSTTPSMAVDPSGRCELQPRPFVMRTFTLRRGNSYLAMVGGLGQLVDDPMAGTATQGSGAVETRPPITKDVWVISEQGDEIAVGEPPEMVTLTQPGPHGGGTLAPRMLDDLYWFGRYGERAEDLLRLVLAVRHTGVERDFVIDSGSALEVLLRAAGELTAGSRLVPGRPDPLTELRELVLDHDRPGTVAQSIGALHFAAQGVRDQLSNDVWIVLAGIERALTALRAARLDRGNQLADSAERVLSGLLALSGITAENMVRDLGWSLLDVGRGLERALQLVALLRWTTVPVRSSEVQDEISEAVLVAAESIVTFRRRHPRGYALRDLITLLVRDPGNPRSVVFQLRRIQARLQAMPDSVATARPLRMLAELEERITSDAVEEMITAPPVDQRRSELEQWFVQLHGSLSQVADAISEQYLQPPPEPRSITFSSAGEQPSADGRTSRADHV